jgi:hypothetical protein
MAANRWPPRCACLARVVSCSRRNRKGSKPPREIYKSISSVHQGNAPPRHRLAKVAIVADAKSIRK